MASGATNSGAQNREPITRTRSTRKAAAVPTTAVAVQDTTTSSPVLISNSPTRGRKINRRMVSHPAVAVENRMKPSGIRHSAVTARARVSITGGGIIRRSGRSGFPADAGSGFPADTGSESAAAGCWWTAGGNATTRSDGVTPFPAGSSRSVSLREVLPGSSDR